MMGVLKVPKNTHSGECMLFSPCSFCKNSVLGPCRRPRLLGKMHVVHASATWLLQGSFAALVPQLPDLKNRGVVRAFGLRFADHCHLHVCGIQIEECRDFITNRFR